jgi:hypothetical protein
LKLPVNPIAAVSLLVLIGLVALALTGIVDNVADSHLDGALATTGGIYATARGINALVSVLQGTELDLPFVTLTIGEILDPINDLIERFSTIVLFALGAVAAQKVLLSLVSADLFNYVLTAIAFLTGFSLLRQQTSLFAPLLKVFLIVVLVRFSLAIVVICNHWVDTKFLGPTDEQRHQSMQEFQRDLQKAKDLATQESDQTKARSLTIKNIERLESLIEIGQKKLKAKELEIAQASAKLSQQMKGEDRVCRLSINSPIISPTCSDALRPYFNDLKREERQKEVIEDSIEGFREQLRSELENLECTIKRMEGEACNLLDYIPSAPDVGAIQGKLDELNGELNHFTENAWLLLISILLKSVAIPLLFFYALLKCTTLIWRSDFETHLS